jgi:tRNA pseudouridine55 synthase
VKAALEAMTGSQFQRPPSYSAKKVAGERSYRRARRGEDVELTPVAVTVETIEVVHLVLPSVSFRTTVSAGTYLRSMARDLGERLGVGAHLESLRREAIGTIRVEDATPVEQLGSPPALVRLERVLGHLEATILAPGEVDDLSHGRPLRRDATTIPASGFVRLMAGGEVVGIARPDGEWLRPVVVLVGT